MTLLRRWLFKLKNARRIHFLFILIFIGLFAISRYSFYRYLPVPLPIVADGSEYYKVYEDMLHGTAHFEIITPGYPLFICVVHELFSEKAIALYYAQSIVALLAALFLLFYIYRYYRACVPFVSIALCFFLCQDMALRFETASFPQSLMVASSFVFLGALIGLLNRPGMINTSLVCASAVYMVLLKSSQLYMLPMLALLICYCFLVNRRKIALRMLAITSIPLLLFASYNYSTFGKFSIIASGVLDQPVRQKSFTKEEQAFFYKIGAHLPPWHPIYKIHHSSGLDTLHNAYLLTRWGTTLKKDTARGVMNLAVTFEMKELVNVDSMVLLNPAFTDAERNFYLQNKDSLEAMPVDFYSKGYKMHRVYFQNFFLNISRDAPLFYYSELKWRFENFYVTRAWAKRYDLTNEKVAHKLSFLLREFYMPPQKTMEQYKVLSEKMAKDPVFKIYDIYDLKTKSLVRNAFWVYLYVGFSILIVALYLIRIRNASLFFLLVLVLIHLGSGMIHAVWADPLNRYSFATEFVPYFLFAFFPLLFPNLANNSRN